ncbi:MAG TPA: polyprenyl synthetase family protein [Thermoplasmata archaeon]|nr:polyprenyl synthetase family protein [Thermoplasmata archaeon]
MEFHDLARWIPSVERTLRASYRKERRAAAPVFRTHLDLLEEFALRGGKRFRALMVLAGYHLATGRSPEAALPAAAGLEHFQSWMLIHDDIIDHSEMRRGGPTLHRTLERAHRAERRLGDAASAGIGLGITLGDLEEPFTLEGLSASPVPAPRRLSAIDEYVRMTRLTAFGQVLDILNGARPVPEVSEADVLLVHRLKSAVYTVASPLRIGATLGGAGKGVLEELDRFGLDTGVAFQLRDDVLGTGFDAGASGKSANDLVEGKRTLLVVNAYQNSGEADRAALLDVLGNPSATSEQVERARSVIERSGSRAHSEDRIRTLSGRAFRRVRASRRFSASGKGLLLEIGDRLVQRSS